MSSLKMYGYKDVFLLWGHFISWTMRDWMMGCVYDNVMCWLRLSMLIVMKYIGDQRVYRMWCNVNFDDFQTWFWMRDWSFKSESMKSVLNVICPYSYWHLLELQHQNQKRLHSIFPWISWNDDHTHSYHNDWNATPPLCIMFVTFHHRIEIPTP